MKTIQLEFPQGHLIRPEFFPEQMGPARTNTCNNIVGVTAQRAATESWKRKSIVVGEDRQKKDAGLGTELLHATFEMTIGFLFVCMFLNLAQLKTGKEEAP